MLEMLQKELKLAGKNPSEAKILISRSLEPIIPHSQDLFLHLDRVVSMYQWITCVTYSPILKSSGQLKLAELMVI
jgi:hypothetical protein